MTAIGCFDFWASLLETVCLTGPMKSTDSIRLWFAFPCTPRTAAVPIGQPAFGPPLPHPQLLEPLEAALFTLIDFACKVCPLVCVQALV